MRTYEQLWLVIAKSTPESPPVKVTCHASHVATLIQAVSKEKSKTNKIRFHTGLPRFGKLRTKTELMPSGQVRISFSLEYNGDHL